MDYMKVNILRFSSPYAGYWLEGQTQTKNNGKNYLKYKDEHGNDRELILNDDVEPITMAESSRLPILGKEKQVPTYLLARDNFLTYKEKTSKTPTSEITKQEGQTLLQNTNYIHLNEGMFQVTGKITNEQITNIADWGMIEALVRATKDKDKYTGLFGKLMLILVIALIVFGVWMAFQWLTTGQIKLPF